MDSFKLTNIEDTIMERLLKTFPESEGIIRYENDYAYILIEREDCTVQITVEIDEVEED